MKFKLFLIPILFYLIIVGVPFFEFKHGELLAFISIIFASFSLIYLYYYFNKILGENEKHLAETLKNLKQQFGIDINPDLTHRKKDD